MPRFHLGDTDSIYYEHEAPTAEQGLTFTFFIALTGDVDMWKAEIVPALKKAGHGAFLYNMRGQRDSPFSPGLDITADQIVSDAVALLKETAPRRPVLVVLSIGGLFAIQAIQQGIEAEGLVLINTLRRDGPRLQWINEALVRMVEVGGMELMRDINFPLIFNEEWLGQNRKDYLKDTGYAPLDSESGTYKLLASGRTADWDLPYEQLTLPVLVMTGMRDHIFYQSEVVAELTARLPNATRLDVPNAGHMVPLERPRVFIDALLEMAQRI